MKWVRAHASELGVDPDRIGGYGHSAGAHLVLMAAMTPDSSEFEGDGCDWEGYSGRLNVVAAGAVPTVPGPRLQQWSRPEWWPIGYISGDAPSMLLMQGSADPIVNVEFVDEFVEELEEAGAPDVEYVRVDGGTHDVAYNQNLDVTRPAMEAFFARTLGVPVGADVSPTVDP